MSWNEPLPSATDCTICNSVPSLILKWYSLTDCTTSSNFSLIPGIQVALYNSTTSMVSSFDLLAHWRVVQSCPNDPDARLSAFKQFFSASVESCDAFVSDSWLSLALRGVADVWSVIRKLSVASIVQQLQQLRRLDHAAPIPLRFMHLVQLARAAKQSWFCADGFLLLIKELAKPLKIANECSPLRLCDCILSEDERVQLAVTHILDFVTHEQLQVRMNAIETIALLREEPLVDRILLSVMPPRLRLGLSMDAPVSTLEGLLELVLRYPSLHNFVMELQSIEGLPLASHEAATVRQSFADFVAKAHGEDVAATVGLLLPLLGGSDEVILEMWARIETLLMSLQCQLRDIICTHARELLHASSSKYKRDSPRPQNVLPRLLQASTCSKFEIRRMGEQVVPLYCQYIAHREPPEALLPLLLSAALKPVHERLCWFLMQRRVVATFVQSTSPMFVLTGKAVVSEIDAALVSQIDPNRSHIPPIVRIILTCYGPRTFRRLATQSDWESALRDPSSSELSIRYAPDFALVSPVAIFIVEHWVRELCNESVACHVQLLLLEAIKNLIASASSSHVMLLFSSRADFRAPSLLDGGDDIPEGFAWLHGMLPVLPRGTKLFDCELVGGADKTTTADDLKVVCCEEVAASLDHSINSSTDTSALPSLPLNVSVLNPLFQNLLVSKIVEPRVVSVLTTILVDLYRRDSIDLVCALRWLLGRLDSLYGRANWILQVVCLGSPQHAGKKAQSNSFDDSDDEEETNVTGANVASEIQRVKDVFVVISAAAQQKRISRHEWISIVKQAFDANEESPSDDAVRLFLDL